MTGGAQGVCLLPLLIDLGLNTFIVCSSLIEDILKIYFDGPQLYSFEILMCQNVPILSYMEYQVINPHVDPTIDIGIWVLKSASIAIGLW